MHLVLLNQYYPPDAAPTGVMLEAVVEALVAQGHKVTVICAEGGYAVGARQDVSFQFSVFREEQESMETRDARREAEESFTDHSHSSTDHRSPVTDHSLIRIPASRFGRGTFVGKVVDYLSYYLGVAWRLMWLRPRPDRIVALTTPPYLSLLARVFSKLRGGDHAHWVMDLYPDVMVAHGMLRDGGLAHRVLAALARWGFGGRRCAAVLSLGPDMAERIGRLTGEMDDTARTRDASAWVPLWGGREIASVQCSVFREEGREADEDAVVALRKARGWVDDEMVVMYSGNMGLGHRFGEILEVIGQRSADESQASADRGQGSVEESVFKSTINNQQSSIVNQAPADGGQGSVDATAQSASSTVHRPVRHSFSDAGSLITDHFTRFVFFGGGKRRGEIEAFVAAHPDAPVELHDYAAADVLTVHLRSADVHLASLTPEWTGTMVPSKLQGIFACGRPVIFLGSAGSSIGRWVMESGGGWVVAPGDVGGLRAALAEAADAGERARRGARAAAFSKSHFDRQTNAAEVATRLTDSIAKREEF